MIVLNETNILLAVIGSIGVIGSFIVFLYGSNRNNSYERKIASTSTKSVAEIASEENAEVL